MKNVKEPSVGLMIRHLRNKQELSLRDLSDLSGLSINAISKIERGENSPTVASLHQLASALEVYITELFQQDIHQFKVFVKKEDATFNKKRWLSYRKLRKRFATSAVSTIQNDYCSRFNKNFRAGLTFR